MWRYTPQTERLLEESSRIGELRTIRSTFSFVLDDPTNIRLRPEVEGGSLMDVGCYCVSAARLLAGEEPVEVSAIQEIGPTGVDVRFSGLLRFPSGVVAEFTSGFGSSHQSIEAIGSAGSVTSNHHPWHDGDGWLLRDGADRIEVPIVDPYQLEIDEVSRAIRGGPAPDRARGRTRSGAGDRGAVRVRCLGARHPPLARRHAARPAQLGGHVPGTSRNAMDGRSIAVMDVGHPLQ